jgi:Fe-S-cluster containining protein
MNETIAKQLQATYDSLPAIQCKRKCNLACGPIGFAPVEIANVQTAGHQIPTMVNHLIHGPLTCSALKGGRCSMYDQRPGICRLYGLTKLLRCQHGCEPDRWLSETEASEFLKSIEALMPGQSVLTCANDLAMHNSAVTIKR